MNNPPPLLYIAGPFRAPTQEGVDLHIQAARHVGALANKKGFATIVPHANTAQMDRILPTIGDDFWLSITMEMMRRCDGVVLVPGWSRSSGTMAEIAEAKRLRIPVFESVDTMPDAADWKS